MGVVDRLFAKRTAKEDLFMVTINNHSDGRKDVRLGIKAKKGNKEQGGLAEEESMGMDMCKYSHPIIHAKTRIITFLNTD